MIVSSIESIQQTLNITLSNAYGHVFIPIEGLIWVRSITVVLIVVVHAVRHVQVDKTTVRSQEVVTEPVHKEEQEQIVVREVRTEQKTLPAPALQKLRAEENRKKVKAYIADYPEEKAKEIVIALSLSLPTVRKYMK